MYFKAFFMGLRDGLKVLPYKKYLEGVAFYAVVALILANMKMLGILIGGWAWIWIFAPLWIPLGITVAIFGLATVFYVGVLLYICGVYVAEGIHWIFISKESRELRKVGKFFVALKEAAGKAK
jgi:hypothetical protein